VHFSRAPFIGVILLGLLSLIFYFYYFAFVIRTRTQVAVAKVYCNTTTASQQVDRCLRAKTYMKNKINNIVA
jgi:hypothetical protein